MSKQFPIIFILDMDKCIIGKSNYLYSYNSLINLFIHKNCEYKRITDDSCKIDKNLWKKHISPYYIRPYFKEFLDFCKINNSILFIFSFGDKLYVEDTIEYIEEIYNYKFNRPLFTREDKYIGINDITPTEKINGTRLL